LIQPSCIAGFLERTATEAEQRAVRVDCDSQRSLNTKGDQITSLEFLGQLLKVALEDPRVPSAEATET